MEMIFLDTSFLVAYYNSDDTNHEEARKLIMTMEGKQVRFLMSDYIFDETLTVLLVRAGKNKAIKVCNAILRDIEIGNIRLIYINEEIFRKSVNIFINFIDKNWSFTDCTSYVLIEDMNIAKCISFDEHFYQFGFDVLP